MGLVTGNRAGSAENMTQVHSLRNRETLTLSEPLVVPEIFYTLLFNGKYELLITSVDCS